MAKMCNTLQKRVAKNIKVYPPSQLGLYNRSRAQTTQHTVMKYNDKKVTRVAKTANVHMTRKPPSFGNQGLITQDRKVHETVVSPRKG